MVNQRVALPRFAKDAEIIKSKRDLAARISSQQVGMLSSARSNVNVYYGPALCTSDYPGYLCGEPGVLQG